jgi:transposase
MLKKSYPNGMTEMEWKRKQGMKLLRSGIKQAQVARKMGVNRRTVYDWKKRVDDDQDFRNRKKKGRNSRLTDKQKEELKGIIDGGATSYGFPTDLWTLKRIADVIEREFGVHYNTTYIWQLLRVLGYSAQIPIAVAMEKDNDYVKKWLSEDYPLYVKEAREHGATILFLDESGMQSRPNVRRTWSIRGKRPNMSVKEARDKISIVSAVSEEGELFFSITYESMKDYNIIAFLEQLLTEIRGFVYIFWDNITIHRSENVKKFLFDNNDRMITRRIPAYSPELNPDELVWDALKYQELSNFCPKSYDELYNKAEATMAKMKTQPEKLKKIILGTKLPLPSTVGK